MNKALKIAAREYLSAGYSIVIDSTNLKKEDWQTWHEIAMMHEVKLTVCDLRDIPIITCHARNNSRDVPIPSDVIDTMYNKYIRGD